MKSTLQTTTKLFERLSSNPAFKDNPKAINGAAKFLKRVGYLSEYNSREWRGEFASIPSDWIKENLGSGGRYKHYLAALNAEGLITWSKYYKVGVDCRRYRLTESGQEMVSNIYEEYSKAIASGDKVLLQKIKKSIRNRGVMNRTHNDPVRDYILDMMNNLVINKDRASLIASMVQHIETEGQKNGKSEDKIRRKVRNAKIAANFTLDVLIEKDFEMLRYNESDGRVWSPYLSINKLFRSGMVYKSFSTELVRIACLDIRACHPTFWSAYVLKCAENMELSELDRANLLIEHAAWVAQFTGAEDPRKRIARETGVKYSLVKLQLNKVINGSIRPIKVINWLSRTYPTLFKVWKSTNVKETGPQISRHFESKITLNYELYNLFNDLGETKAGYEYDGFSLFFEDSDPEIRSKVAAIEAKIKELSLRQFGFEIILKVEYFDAPQSEPNINMQAEVEPLEETKTAPETMDYSIQISEPTVNNIEDDWARMARESIEAMRSAKENLEPTCVGSV